jgi:transcriptional regulator with PAS, ATPase and Fis domain
LYYRLRVVEVRIPPLRQRPDELRELLRVLLPTVAARVGRPITAYSARAIDALCRYLWPGNIRELEHAIERACALATAGIIDLEDLPEEVRPPQPATAARVRPLVDHEVAYVVAVVERHGGNRQAAAAELRISMSTLQRRLRLARRAIPQSPPRDSQD